MEDEVEGARTGEKCNQKLNRKTEGRDHLIDLGIDGRMI
jgi:hypothetical protein